jgi:hypothetical protein
MNVRRALVPTREEHKKITQMNVTRALALPTQRQPRVPAERSEVSTLSHNDDEATHAVSTLKTRCVEYVVNMYDA